MSIKLYVGNLAFETSSTEVREMFAQAGTVESASIIEDRETGRSRGFGFVEMATNEDGQAAALQLIDEVKSEVDRLNRVEIAVDKEVEYTEGDVILIRKVKEVKWTVPAVIRNEEANKQIEFYFTEIQESRKRVRKTQTEINRLKKKTQAILDKLP